MNSSKVLFCLVIVSLLGSCGRSSEKKYFKEAKYYMAEGQYERAVDSFKRAIAAAPKTDTAMESLYMLGELYYQMSEFRKALKIFNKYLEIAKINDKRRFETLTKIAFINYSKLANYNAAINNYSRSLKYAHKNEQRFDVFLNMGQCYFQTYQFDRAINYFKKATELVGSFPSDMKDKVQEVFYYTAFSYSMLLQDFAEHKKQGANIQIYEKSNADEPLGKVLEILEKCLSYSTESKYGVLCSFHKAETLEELGDNKAALAIFEALKPLYPNQAVLETKINKLLDK